MEKSGPTTRILLARHGEADYETEGSGDSGGSLTPAGRQQARRLGQRLIDFHPVALICSELSRAVQTAEIAAAELSLPVQVRVGLQEYDVGDERGRPYNAELFEPLLRHWLHGELSVGIPGGEDGHAVSRRMFDVLEDVAARFAGQAVAVVSHGGAIISVLGTIAPDGPDLPIDGDDMPGCDTYELILSDGEWNLSTRTRG